MLPRDALPDDAADWSNVAISLDRLQPDTLEGCPRNLDDLVAYLRLESSDLNDTDPARLRFVRSAALGSAKAWIWEYTESDGEVAFVTVHLTLDGESTLGLASPNGLNHEQFLLAEHYGEVYWG